MKEKTIYALGFFDGVHLGHQALLLACRHLAERSGCTPGAVTFTTHPEMLVQGKAPMLINSIEDRCWLLCGHGMAQIVQLPFDAALRSMPWRDFLQMLQKEHGAVGFVCGDDFRFGYRGEGNAQLLGDYCKENNLPWAVVPAQSCDGIRISSTHIRTLLTEGNMGEAARFLGHPHILSGVVVKGRQLGRTIGIPTANLALPEGVLCPKLGVYACKTIVDGGEYLAVTNIGTRPTVGGHHITVEPWLLDFEGDLYGKPLTLYFHAFLRPEQKFDSLEQLQAAIRENARQTRDLLENIL